MPNATTSEKGKRLALLVMLIMGTILHGSSVAHIYLSALRRVGFLLAGVVR